MPTLPHTILGGQEVSSPMEILSRNFWRKVSKTDTCWNWTGADDGKGYGRLWNGKYGALLGFSGKMIQSHRFSWILHHGNIAEGLCVLHKCDNPSCVNPDHLFLGTLQDNVVDMIDKNRQSKGESCHLSKMTFDQVTEIRRVYKRIMHTAIRQTANETGCDYEMVYDVIRENTWKSTKTPE